MELIEVVDRLSVEFAGELPQDTVEIVVKRTAAQWDGAPVQGYIPLLTENAARQKSLAFDVHVNDMLGWFSARTYAETVVWSMPRRSEASWV